MKSITRWSIIVLVLTAGQVLAGDTASLAFTDLTVIDATDAPARPGMTVVIRGDRIAAIGKTGEVAVPEDAEVVDAAGRFLIPGLWDMHIHTRGYAPPLYVACGVTGRRIMWGNRQDLERREAEGTGEPPAPRSCVASPLVDGPEPVWRRSTVVATAEEGRRVVREMKAEGYDFLKVYARLPREAYFAIAEEARKLDFPIAGHVPRSVSVREASEAGQRSIEHLDGLYLACSSREEELREALREEKRWHDQAALAKQVRESFDEARAAALFARFVANGTWHVPTLTLWNGRAHSTDDRTTGDPRLRYIPETAEWLKMAEGFAGRGVDFDLLRRWLRQDLELVGAMHRAGVRILAGTDAGNPFCMPGFSLHDELELLVRAGLSPIEALRAATRDAAEYLGRLDDLGTVEEGKLADLVLLRADPLEDIGNTRKIEAVVLGGRHLPRSVLDEMLAAAEERVRESR